jgi:predicted enzyme related to lactoylglutathione lyase
MSQRFQLALNVENLETAVNYYSKLFGTKVNKRKPGYANFSMTNPPLKLVLIENPGAAERINHLGIETDQQSDVDDAISRFKSTGIAGEEEVAEVCCFAKKNKIWSTDPGGTDWEWYRILEDSPTARASSDQARCC